MGKVISRAQQALLQVARRQLNLQDYEYKEILRQFGDGVTSSKKLRAEHFEETLNYLKKLGFEPKPKRESHGDRPGMGTPAQLAYIRDLWSIYTDGAGTDASFRKWLERFFKVSHERFLTADAARQALAALLRMTQRRPEAPGNNKKETNDAG